MRSFTSVLVLLGAASHAATPGPLLLSLEPEKIELCEGADTKIRVVVQNAADAAVRAVKVRSFTSLPLTVKIAGNDPGGVTIAKGAAAFWEVTIGDAKPPAALPDAGKIYFHASTRTADVGTMLEVKRRPREQVSQVAKLDVKGPVGAITEERRPLVPVVLTNTSAHELTVTSLSGTGGPSLELTGGSASFKPVKIEAGAAEAFVFRASAAISAPGAAESVMGKQGALIIAAVQWTDGACPRAGTLVSTVDAEIGVTGESELLTLLGVPSILVLPGFLLLAACQLLWKAGLRFVPDRTRDFPIATKTPEFWVLAVTVSFLVSFLVAPKTPGHSFTGYYDLQDIRRLWTTVVGISAVVYSAAWLLYRLVHYVHSKREEGRRFHDDDRVEQVLATLANRRQPLGFRKVKRDNKGAALFDLGADETGQSCFVAGSMLLTLPPNVADPVNASARRFSTVAAKANDLREFLKNNVEIKASWRDSTPRWVAKSELTEVQTPEPIVDVEQ